MPKYYRVVGRPTPPHQTSQDFWQTLQDIPIAEKIEIVSGVLQMLGQDLKGYPVRMVGRDNLDESVLIAQKLFLEMMTAIAALKLEDSKPIIDTIWPQALDRINDIITMIKQTVDTHEHEEQQSYEEAVRHARSLRGKKVKERKQPKTKPPKLEPTRPVVIKTILSPLKYDAPDEEEQAALQALGDLLDAKEVQPGQEAVGTLYCGLKYYRKHLNQISLDLLEHHEILDRIAVRQWQKENSDEAPTNLDNEQLHRCLKDGSTLEKLTALKFTSGKTQPPEIQRLINVLRWDCNKTVRYAAAQQTLCEAPKIVGWLSQLDAPPETLDLPTSSNDVDYEPLFRHLVAGEWEQADGVTYDLIMNLIGCSNSWMRPEELALLPASDLMIIDRLWRLCSGNRFGFSVQAELYRELDRQSLYKGYADRIKYSSSELWGYELYGRDKYVAVEETFAALVGWKSREYRGSSNNNWTNKWTFQRNDRVPYDCSAPVGHLPSTFKLGGGEYKEWTSGGDSYGSLWVDEYTYYTWSKDSFVASDFLREFYRYFNCL